MPGARFAPSVERRPAHQPAGPDQVRARDYPRCVTAPDAALSPSTRGAVSAHNRGWLRQLLVANLVLQMVIIVTGGLVRLTGSGLGCSTWPQCTPGSFTPVAGQEQGYHPIIEFGNRLLTFVLAAVAIALIVAARRWASDRPGFFRLTWVPLLGILAQAVIGGIIVLASLDPKTVSPHFLLSVALVAFSAWLLRRYDEGEGRRVPAVSSRLQGLAHAASGAFAVIVVLGTAVTGSGPHSGDADEPVRFGFDPLVTARFHSAAVWVFVAAVVLIAVLARRDAADSSYRSAWDRVLVLALLEGGLGYLQYATQLPWGLVAVHMGLSAVLTAAVTFAVMSTRAVVPEPAKDQERQDQGIGK